ncbi:MAG: plasmid partitioning/stability family protein [Hafnia sp.]
MKSAVTRRVSFYLKPGHVKAEKIACDLLDAMPASERAKVQRTAMLAGLALMKQDARLPGLLAELLDENTDISSILHIINSITPNNQNTAPLWRHLTDAPASVSPTDERDPSTDMRTMKSNASGLFPV